MPIDLMTIILTAALVVLGVGLIVYALMERGKIPMPRFLDPDKTEADLKAKVIDEQEKVAEAERSYAKTTPGTPEAKGAKTHLEVREEALLKARTAYDTVREQREASNQRRADASSVHKAPFGLWAGTFALILLVVGLLLRLFYYGPNPTVATRFAASETSISPLTRADTGALLREVIQDEVPVLIRKELRTEVPPLLKAEVPKLVEAELIKHPVTNTTQVVKETTVPGPVTTKTVYREKKVYVRTPAQRYVAPPVSLAPPPPRAAAALPPRSYGQGYGPATYDDRQVAYDQPPQRPAYVKLGDRPMGYAQPGCDDGSVGTFTVNGRTLGVQVNACDGSVYTGTADQVLDRRGQVRQGKLFEQAPQYYTDRQGYGRQRYGY